MSASTCIAFFGLRFEISPEEIETLEARSDQRMLAARKVGLKCYWANFGAPGERYLLFVGTQLGILGPENESELVMHTQELHNLVRSTKAKLEAADLIGEPSLHLQLIEDE